MADSDFIAAFNKRYSDSGFDPQYRRDVGEKISNLVAAAKNVAGKKRSKFRQTGAGQFDPKTNIRASKEQLRTEKQFQDYDAMREELAGFISGNVYDRGKKPNMQEARDIVDSFSKSQREQHLTAAGKTMPRIALPPQSSSAPSTIEKGTSDFSSLEGVAPSSFSPSPINYRSSEPDPLEKRKLLAEELRQFAAGKSKETAQSLKEQGGEIGVTPTQLSNLYKQYKAESEKGPTKLDGGSTFEQEEEQARARSKASGAFGGDDWRGRSSANSVSTPNLDQYASDAFGARPMGSERRMITSPEGQMRLMARKAARAGIDVGQLISATKGDVMAAFGELEASGLGARGIRSQEEVRARPELASQLRESRANLLKQQAEEFRKAEEERIAKEEADRKEKERLAKEEEERKEKERLAAEKEGDITAQRGVGELANTNSRPSRDSSPRLANPNSRPTNPNRA